MIHSIEKSCLVKLKNIGSEVTVFGKRRKSRKKEKVRPIKNGSKTRLEYKEIMQKILRSKR